MPSCISGTDLTVRELYKRWKKAVGRSIKRGFDFDGLARVLCVAFRVLKAFAVAVEDVEALLYSFCNIFALDRVVAFLKSNPDWLRTILAVSTTALAIAAAV